MMRGMRKEITGIFMVLSPMMNNLVDYKNLKSFAMSDRGTDRILELAYFNNMSIRYIFDKSNYLLLKTEIMKDQKMISSSAYRFDTYKNQYLLSGVDTDFMANKVLKTSVTIKYNFRNNMALPQEIGIRSDLTGSSIGDKIALIVKEVS